MPYQNILNYSNHRDGLKTWAKRSYRVWANSPHVGERVCMSHHASPCPVIPAPTLGMSCHRTQTAGSNDSCSVSGGVVQTALMAPGAMTEEAKEEAKIVIKAGLCWLRDPKASFYPAAQIGDAGPSHQKRTKWHEVLQDKDERKKKKKSIFLTRRFRPVSCVSLLRQLCKKPWCLNESESPQSKWLQGTYLLPL